MRNRTTQQLVEALVSVEARMVSVADLPIMESSRRWSRLVTIANALRLVIAGRLDGSHIIAQRHCA